MKLLLIVLCLTLVGCLGPSLFTVSGLKITASDVITVPNKIEVFRNNKND
jgi:hypothetical protein